MWLSDKFNTLTWQKIMYTITIANINKQLKRRQYILRLCSKAQKQPK